jgi:hypothetical protein
VRGTSAQPNRYSWTTGRIPQRAADASYRVVLALSDAQSPVPAAVGVSQTINQFSPRYVALIGIAGGLRDYVAQGDIIVGTYVWGFGYARIDEAAAIFPVVSSRSAWTARSWRIYAPSASWSQHGGSVSPPSRVRTNGPGWNSAVLPPALR